MAEIPPVEVRLRLSEKGERELVSEANRMRYDIAHANELLDGCRVADAPVLETRIRYLLQLLGSKMLEIDSLNKRHATAQRAVSFLMTQCDGDFWAENNEDVKAVVDNFHNKHVL